MVKKKKKQTSVLGLIVALVVVIAGSVLFVGAVSGWFDGRRVILDAGYYGEGEMMELSVEEYEKLAEEKKSFIVFVDQDGCTTADRLREYMTNYMAENGILAYRMMFSEMKESSLHEDIKYYPSVVMVSDGRVVGFLQADSDEDADEYNDYSSFKGWMDTFLK